MGCKCVVCFSNLHFCTALPIALGDCFDKLACIALLAYVSYVNSFSLLGCVLVSYTLIDQTADTILSVANDLSNWYIYNHSAVVITFVQVFSLLFFVET